MNPAPPITPARLIYEAHPSILKYWRVGAMAFICGPGGWLLGEAWPASRAIGSLMALGILLAATLHRMSVHYLITNRRIEIIQGLVAKSSREIQLAHVKAIHVAHHGWIGLLGVGTVTFSADGGATDDIVFRDVAQANKVKSLIRAWQDRNAAPPAPRPNPKT
jgi:uncharacterized membrane protein YdbT with pleckstrin-like domain